MCCVAQPGLWLCHAAVKAMKTIWLLGRYLPKCKLNIDAFRKLAALRARINCERNNYDCKGNDLRPEIGMIEF